MDIQVVNSWLLSCASVQRVASILFAVTFAATIAAPSAASETFPPPLPKKENIQPGFAFVENGYGRGSAEITKQGHP